MKLFQKQIKHFLHLDEDQHETISQLSESEYRKLGEEALQTAWRVLNSPGWKLEKSLDNGDTVHSKHISRGKKIFKLDGIVDIPPKLLLEELFYQIESVPSWNPTLVECKLVQHIDSHTDVSYQVCAEAAQGVVSTRDFVNLRHWNVVDDVFVSSGVSIKHPAMPEQPKRVRGENGPGCWAMRPVQNNPDQCHFQWLLDTDLKGWIPQYIIDSALAGAQFEYIKYIRNYAASLHENGRVQSFLEAQAAVAESLNETISTVVSMT